MTSTAAYPIRDIQRGDAESWAGLYSCYRSFYEVPTDDSAVAITWGWVLGREPGLRGIVAVAPGGEVAALANLRIFARPSIGKMGL